MQQRAISIEAIQNAYRRQLAGCWQIASGAHILEIGCGQGDMTCVLAETASRVIAVDIAERSYGAPLTLGEATDIIKSGPLGERIDFRFEFDILREGSFSPDIFDYGVMAHCSWYFSGEEELAAVLSRLRSCCRQLCFAEWDLEPQSLEQVPHLLAVLVQGQVESFKSSSSANVRTPFSRNQLERLLSTSGWEIARTCTPETSGLQDADWEIDVCLSRSLQEAQDLKVPPRLYSLLASEVELMLRMKEKLSPKPLGSYALVATHSGTPAI